MIPFIKPIFPPLEECRDYFEKIYDNKHFTNNGPCVQELESVIQEYLGTHREIILVNNATSGLLMAVKSLGLRAKEILVPSFTFPATVGSIKWCGVKYRYIDIDPDTYCMDPALIENELLENDNIGAIMPVNCFGNVCDVNKIEKIALAYGLKVIYDSAPAMGSEIGGTKVGNFGDIEVFSLHATKILPVGEGGFLSVKDRETAQKLREMKNFGFDTKKNIVSDGLNFKMPEFNAVFGLVGLKYLNKYITNRREYVGMYYDELANMEFVKFQNTDHCRSSYQGLTIRVSGGLREKLYHYLMNHGIECKKYFDIPLHMTGAYLNTVLLPNTELISSQVLSLPLYSQMDVELIQHISKIIHSFREGLCQNI